MLVGCCRLSPSSYQQNKIGIKGLDNSLIYQFNSNVNRFALLIAELFGNRKPGKQLMWRFELDYEVSAFFGPSCTSESSRIGIRIGTEHDDKRKGTFNALSLVDQSRTSILTRSRARSC